MRRDWLRLGLPAALAVAAVNFAAQLGTRRLSAQESLSLREAAIPLHDVVSTLSGLELAPPAYFFGLHEWIFRISRSPASLRLPSMLAGLALVAAVYWLARRLADRRAAVLAALLTAVSPLVLEFAQLARPSIFAMLGVTVAVAAGLEAERTGGRPARQWLGVSLVAGLLAIATDYSSVLVVGPLAVWLALRAELSRAARIAQLGVIAYGVWVAALLAAEQLEHADAAREPGAASLSGTHALRVLGGPFDGRLQSLSGWTVAGAVVVVVAAAAVLARGRPRARVAAGLALVGPLVALVLTLGGSAALATRYTAVSAPLAVVTIGCAAMALLPRRAGAALAGAALVCALAASLLAHDKTSRASASPGRRAGDAARPAASSSASRRSARAAAPIRL